MYELVPTYPLKKPRQKHLWIKAFTGSSKLLINQTNSVSMIQLSCAFRIDRCLSLNCDWHHWTQLFVTPPSPPPPPRPQPREPRSSLVAQTVKNLPAIQETQVWSLGREDPLEKGMAIHSSILAWRISWIEEPAGYSPWGCKESDTTEQLTHCAWNWVVRLNKDSVVDVLHNLFCCYFCYKPWKEVYTFLILMPCLLLILVQIKQAHWESI